MLVLGGHAVILSLICQGLLNHHGFLDLPSETLMQQLSLEEVDVVRKTLNSGEISRLTIRVP
jgi:hypothetical protein